MADTDTKTRSVFQSAPAAEGLEIFVGHDTKVYALLIHAQRENWRFYEKYYLIPLGRIRAITPKSELPVAYIRLLKSFEKEYGLFLYSQEKTALGRAEELAANTIPQDLVDGHLAALEELEDAEGLREHVLTPEEISNLVKKYVLDLKKQLAREGKSTNIPGEDRFTRELSAYIQKRLPEAKNASELRPILVKATRDVYYTAAPESTDLPQKLEERSEEVTRAADKSSWRFINRFKPSETAAEAIIAGAGKATDGFWIDGEILPTPAAYMDRLFEIAAKPSDLTAEQAVEKAFKIAKTDEALQMAALSEPQQEAQAIDTFLSYSAKPAGLKLLATMSAADKKGLATELVVQSAREKAQEQTQKIVDMMLRNAVSPPSNVGRYLPHFRAPGLAIEYTLSYMIAQTEAGRAQLEINPIQTIYVFLDLKNLLGFITKAEAAGAGARITGGISIKSTTAAAGGVATKGVLSRAIGSILGFFGFRIGGAAAGSAVGGVGGSVLGGPVGAIVGAVVVPIITKSIGGLWRKLKETFTEGHLGMFLTAVSDVLTGRSRRPFAERDRSEMILIGAIIIGGLVIFPMFGSNINIQMLMAPRAEVLDEAPPPPDDPIETSGFTAEQLLDPAIRRRFFERPHGEFDNTPAIQYDGPLPEEYEGDLLCPVFEGAIRSTPDTHSCTSALCQNAYDIAGNGGTTVYSTHGGYLAGYNNNYTLGEYAEQSYGNFVTLVGNGGGSAYYTIYGHMQQTPLPNAGGGDFSLINQAVGAYLSGGTPVYIPAGTPLGVVDDTGTSTGDHLHYGYSGPLGENFLPPSCL